MYSLADYATAEVIRAYNTLDAGAVVDSKLAVYTRDQAATILHAQNLRGMNKLVADIAQMRGLLGIEFMDDGEAAVLKTVGNFFDHPLRDMGGASARIPLPAVAAIHWCIHTQRTSCAPPENIATGKEWVAALLTAQCALAFHLPDLPIHMHIEGAMRGSVDACLALVDYYRRNPRKGGREEVVEWCVRAVQHTGDRDIPVWAPWTHILARISEFMLSLDPRLGPGCRARRFLLYAARSGHGFIGQLGTIALKGYLDGHLRCAYMAHYLLSDAGKNSTKHVHPYALCLFAGIGTPRRVDEAFKLLHDTFCFGSHSQAECPKLWFTEGDGEVEGAGAPIEPVERPEGYIMPARECGEANHPHPSTT